MTLGQTLAKLRNENNTGQKELAILLNVSVGTISNYENDVHKPSPEMLCRLADCFGVSVDYILGRTRFRFGMDQLKRRLSKDYTVTDVIDMMVGLDSNTIEHLMEYAKFLETRHSQQPKQAFFQSGNSERAP